MVEPEAWMTGTRSSVSTSRVHPPGKRLRQRKRSRGSVPAVVQARVPKGLAISMYGLNGLLPIGQVRASAEVPRRRQLIVCFASGWGTNRGLIFSALMRTPARSSCRSVCPLRANCRCSRFGGSTSNCAAAKVAGERKLGQSLRIELWSSPTGAPPAGLNRATRV